MGRERRIPRRPRQRDDRTDARVGCSSSRRPRARACLRSGECGSGRGGAGSPEREGCDVGLRSQMLAIAEARIDGTPNVSTARPGSRGDRRAGRDLRRRPLPGELCSPPIRPAPHARSGCVLRPGGRAASSPSGALGARARGSEFARRRRRAPRNDGRRRACQTLSRSTTRNGSRAFLPPAGSPMSRSRRCRFPTSWPPPRSGGNELLARRLARHSYWGWHCPTAARRLCSCLEAVSSYRTVAGRGVSGSRVRRLRAE